MPVFDGQLIIVTGGGSGIGRQAAIALAANGARVSVADIAYEAAQETCAMIAAAGGIARAQRVDVAIEDEVAAMVADSVAAFGPLYGAFNNAGIEMHYKAIVDLDAAEWQRVIDINLTGVFYCLKHEMRALIAQGAGGAIVNTSSGNGVVAQANSADYIGSKFGVVGLSKAAAVEGGPHRIRVNAICPGLIMTPMVEERLNDTDTFQTILDGFRKRHVIGRFGTTQDVADAVLWLMSPQSTFITGTAIPVDGGYLAQ